MSNPANHPSRPQPHRVPPGPELEPEITAQPRQPSDELGEADGGQSGLSVDPEDMGVRFLSEATEQGEALRHGAMDSELSLMNGPASDEVLTPPNFERENTLWEQTVDLVTQTQNASDQLRGSVSLEDEDDPSERESELEENLEFNPNASDIREISLLDQPSERDGDDETTVPNILDDEEAGGIHSRTAPRHELGAQVEGSPEPAAPRKRAAISGKPVELCRRAAEATLRGVARTLRRISRN
jgi:hypothetical protein